MKFAVVILAFVAFASSGTFVFGCVMAPGPVPQICERFWDGDAVALATVARIEKVSYKRLVTLRIVEVFRGDPPPEVVFDDPQTDCGENFSSLDTELVWFYREHDKWKAYSNQPDEQVADLAFARSMKNPPSGARVFGSVGRADLHTIAMGGPPSMGAPLSGALVVAQGTSGRYETTVDKKGNFELSSLSPGQYEISVEGLPPNLDDEPVPVALARGQCKEIHFRPDTSGEISGKLIPGGNMPSPAWVTLFTAHHAPKRADSNEDTREVAQLFADDETGKFVFRHVHPGRYIVAFQPGDPPDMNVPYWPSFYPGTKDREDAEVLEIAEGQKITDLQFKIGDEAARRKVFVRAIWEDGTIAENVHLQLRNSKNASNITHQDVYTDSKGEGALEAFLGISYVLEPHATCRETSPVPLNLAFPVRPSHQSREIKNVMVPASAVDVQVSIIVPGPKCTLLPKFGFIEDD